MARCARCAEQTIRCATILLVVIALIQVVSANDLNGGFDHRSHSVPGESQTVFEDPPGSGHAWVELDGSDSHSHYFNQGPPVETGRIVKFVWRNLGNDKVIGRKAVVFARFPIGKTTVELTVTDQTGDSSSDETTITVVKASRSIPGAIAYFYYTRTTKRHANSFPRPMLTEWIPYINIMTQMSTPKRFQGSSHGAIRLSFNFDPLFTAKQKFAISYGGGDLAVYDNNGFVIGGSAKVPGQRKVARFVSPVVKGKPKKFEVLLTRTMPNVHLVLLYTVKGRTVVVPKSRLTYNPAAVVPVLENSSLKKASIDGGEMIELKASGLDGAGKITVLFRMGKIVRFLDIEKVDARTQRITGLIPSFPKAGKAQIRILTKSKGPSNYIPFTFVNGDSGDSPGQSEGSPFQKLAFRETELKRFGKPYRPSGITSIALGPDGRYYLGSLSGVISVLKVNHALVIVGACDSPRVDNSRSILGIAFNPRDSYTLGSAQAYITLSGLYWPMRKKGLGWANGKVVIWKSVPRKACMIYIKEVLTGLPVSARDHGVNAITFDNHNNMYVTIGSNTNAGLKSSQFSNLDETPLSAAVLIARLGRPGFKGAVTYNQLKSPGTAKKTGGSVEIFATGLRNSFGIIVHSNGKVYATDNGHNQNFGAISTSCTTQRNPTKTDSDKLVFVKKGGYYGMPNRNRGECKYIANAGAIAKLPSSTTGIMEYTANTFGGRIYGSIFLSKFAVQNSGILFRAVLKGDGTSLTGPPTEVKKVSGIGIAQGKLGELFMPQVQQKRLRVLVPVEHGGGRTPRVITVIPRRGPKSGGNTVLVSGRNLNTKTKITFNGKACVGVSQVDAGSVTCRPPAGSGFASVVASNAGGVSKSINGEYIYV